MNLSLKDILIYYLGLVFIFASIHRIYLKSQREEEAYEVLKLPKYSDIFIIIFEFTVGVLLLTNFKYKLHALFLLMVFLIIGSILIIIHNMDKLLETYHEIWTYQPTSMSFVLHLAYIVIIAAILWESKIFSRHYKL
jgi:uncharacterized membrane protein YphA (DoxX/SURF4 family)